MIRKVAAVYSLLVGLSMVAVWLLFFATGKVFGAVPSLSGLTLTLHITAEFATAAAMLAAAAGLLANRSWGKPVYFCAIGMMIYALINSAGFYTGGPGAPYVIAIFASSLIMALIFLAAGFLIEEDKK